MVQCPQRTGRDERRSPRSTPMESTPMTWQLCWINRVLQSDRVTIAPSPCIDCWALMQRLEPAFISITPPLKSIDLLRYWSRRSNFSEAWNNIGSIGFDSAFCPHPKSLSLGERDFESCSLLPKGEGLGMRASYASACCSTKGRGLPTP
jgi:hypothetical protein